MLPLSKLHPLFYQIGVSIDSYDLVVYESSVNDDKMARYANENRES